MTLRELAHQLFELSDGGYFNREKFTEGRLRNYIAAQTQGDDQKTIVMEIALPDGWWNFEISRIPQFGEGFYSYSIPETRNEEKAVLSRLYARNNEKGGASNEE